MAPIRRYLRITRYSVLEVRIYLEDPSLSSSWLLSSRSPALPRVIAAVRPLVLPKLREENEHSKGGGGSKKKHRATKDTVSGTDFDVSIFLTNTSSSHALLTKIKTFREPGKRRLESGDRLGIARYMSGAGAGAADDPVDVDAPVLRREEEDGDEQVRMADVPPAQLGQAIDVHSSGSEDEEEEVVPRRGGKGKRKRATGKEQEDDDGEANKKKKLGLRTGYEGFSIYGRILCLIVKRKGTKARTDRPAGGSEMLENWVGTQVEGVVDDEG